MILGHAPHFQRLMRNLFVCRLGFGRRMHARDGTRWEAGMGVWMRSDLLRRDRRREGVDGSRATKAR